jgi:hypothetical protein
MTTKQRDLIAYRRRRGREALKALWRRAGFSDGYLKQIMGGHRPITLRRALLLVELTPELDLIALLEMQDRLLLRKVRQLAGHNEQHTRRRR